MRISDWSSDVCSSDLEEDFFPEDSWISALKIRASYGLTGNAVAGYYEYINRYGSASGYYFGTSVSRVSGRALQVPRDISTWEKAEKLNIDLDLRSDEHTYELQSLMRK